MTSPWKLSRTLAVAVAAALCAGNSALGDAGGSGGTGPAWRVWSWDPVLLLNLGLLWWLYGRGLSRLWPRSPAAQAVAGGRGLAFLGGLAAIFLALASPIDAVGGQLASIHMLQHMLLMIVAAPLIVLGDPARVVPPGLPRHARRTLANCRKAGARLSAGVLRDPCAVWLLHAAALWAWHVPALYEAALRSPVMHDAQHLTFFGASVLYWRVLLDPARARRLQPAAAVLSLFTTSLHASALGILLALSPQTWYRAFDASTPAWGISPLEDQQLAGLIMWMPGCAAYALAAAAILGRWLSAQSRLDQVCAARRDGGEAGTRP